MIRAIFQSNGTLFLDYFLLVEGSDVFQLNRGEISESLKVSCSFSDNLLPRFPGAKITMEVGRSA